MTTGNICRARKMYGKGQQQEDSKASGTLKGFRIFSEVVDFFSLGTAISQTAFENPLNLKTDSPGGTRNRVRIWLWRSLDCSQNICNSNIWLLNITLNTKYHLHPFLAAKLYMLLMHVSYQILPKINIVCLQSYLIPNIITRLPFTVVALLFCNRRATTLLFILA